MFYQKIANHFVHDLDLGPAGFIDNDPDAALKRSEKIAVHLKGQAFGFPIFQRFPGSIGVLVHDQHPSCLLKATASA